MPDLNPDGTVNLDPDPPTNAHLEPAAIANCHRCDRDGYRGTVVCDHQDHEIAKGRAAVQAALAEIRHRKVEAARQPHPLDRPRSTEADENGSDDRMGAEGVR